MATDSSFRWRTAAFWLRPGLKPVAVVCNVRFDLPGATLDVTAIAHDDARWKLVRDATLDLRRKYNDKLSKVSAHTDNGFRFLRPDMRRFSVAGSATTLFGYLGGFTAVRLQTPGSTHRVHRARQKRNSCPAVLAASTHRRFVVDSASHAQGSLASKSAKGGKTEGAGGTRNVRGLLQAAGVLWAEGERRRALVAKRGGKAASMGDSHSIAGRPGGKHHAESAPSVSSGRSAVTAPALVRGAASAGFMGSSGSSVSPRGLGWPGSGSGSGLGPQDARWPRQGDMALQGAQSTVALSHGGRSVYSSTKSVSGAAWDVVRVGQTSEGGGVANGPTPAPGNSNARPGQLRVNNPPFVAVAPGSASAAGGMLSGTAGYSARSPDTSVGTGSDTRGSGHARTSMNTASPTSMGTPAGSRLMQPHSLDTAHSVSGLGYGPRTPVMMGGAYAAQQAYMGHLAGMGVGGQPHYMTGPGGMQGMIAMPMTPQGYTMTPSGHMMAMHLPGQPGMVNHPAFMPMTQGMQPMQQQQMQAPMAWHQGPGNVYGQPVFVGYPGMHQQQQNQQPGP